MTLEEAGGDPVEVWPDNLSAVNLFIAMGTQWRSGIGVVTGLDYSALPAIMRLTGIKPAERSDVFNEIRIMEDTVLEMKSKKK